MTQPTLITVTLWRTYSRGRRHEYTWRSFIDTFVKSPEIVRDKKKVAGFSLGSFVENRRALTRVEKVFALTLDFDSGDTPIKRAPRLLLDTLGVAYTTFSHSPEHPKLRAIFLLSRPVDAAEYERIWYWASQKIGPKHVLDESARDASRFWFLPSHAPGAPYEWRELEGKPLDVEAVLGKNHTHTRPLPSGGLSRLLTAPVADPARNERDVWDAADQSFFGRAFVLSNMAFGLTDNGALSVVCPWAHTHTSGTDGDTSTVILPPTTEARWGLFHCSHAHCARRAALDLLEVLDPAVLLAARREHGGGLVRTCVRAGFVQRFEALEGHGGLDPGEGFKALERFVLRCYPLGGAAPLVWTVKIGSRAHTEGLEALPLMALRGRKVDLAVREGPRGGKEITWGRIVPDEVVV